MEKIILVLLLILGSLLIFKTNIDAEYGNQQFTELAGSIINGNLDITKYTFDTAVYQGKYYWPLGPFPSVLLIPFVAVFGDQMQQGYMSALAIILTIYPLYKISKKITGDKKLSLWLSIGYIFSTAYIGLVVNPQSWYFAEIIGATCLTYAFYEYLYKKRWWVIGLSLGFAVATRLNLLIAAVFFILIILFDTSRKKEKIINLIKFFLPVALCISLLLVYNYLRFHNFFESGYKLQVLHFQILRSQLQFGQWSLQHIPSNLYYFLLKGPDAIFIPETKTLQFPYVQVDTWGMSILLTSPMFLWLTGIPHKKHEILFASFTVILMAFAIFGYYGIGWIQYGYRYAVDFYPLLFFLLAYAVKHKQTFLLKTVIFISFFTNIYLAWLVPIILK